MSRNPFRAAAASIVRLWNAFINANRCPACRAPFHTGADCETCRAGRAKDPM